MIPHPFFYQLVVLGRFCRKVRFFGKIQKLGVWNSRTYRLPNSLKSNFATEPSTLQAWVQDGPQGCGLDRANWTYEELATHLYRTTGIEVKRTTMRVFCQRHDIRPYRPTY